MYFVATNVTVSSNFTFGRRRPMARTSEIAAPIGLNRVDFHEILRRNDHLPLKPGLPTFGHRLC